MNNVIRSFLVSLGWDIDQSGMNQFATSIAVQTEAVRVLGEGLEAAARKVVSFASDVAEGMDKLYFASLRTKSSAANLEALKYAVEQTGGATEAFMAHVQNLNNLLNTKDGFQNWFEGIGVHADKARDRVAILLDFVERTKTMSDREAYARARVLGIDPTDLDEMRRPEFAKFVQEGLDAQKKAGFDAKKAADAGHDWQTEMRRLSLEVEIFKNGIGAELLGKALPYLEKFVTTAVNLVLKLINWWKNLDTQTKTTIKWALAIAAGLATLVAGLTIVGTIVGVVVAAFEPLLALLGLLFNPISLLVQAVVALGAAFYFGAFDGMMKQLHELVDFINDHLQTALANAKSDWDDLVGRILYGKPTGTPGGPTRFNGMDEAKDKLYGFFTGKGLDGTGGAQGSGPLGIRNNNPGNLKFVGQAGAHRAGAFAAFDTAQEGLNALSRQLGIDVFKRGARNLTDIVNQWLGNDPQENAQSHRDYVADLVRSMNSYQGVSGITGTGALNFSDPHVVEALEAAMIRHENGQNPYTPEMLQRSLGAGGFGATAAAAPVTINQSNTTTITGATDPAGVAKTISSVMQQNNSMLVRSLQARTS